MKTEFRINFLPNYKDCSTISFVDESTYPVNPEFPALKITLPDINKFVEIAYSPKMVNVITGTSIGISDLPDGLWTFEFSVKPNSKVFTKVSDYRICKGLNKIKDSLCNNPSDENIKEQMANWRGLFAAKEIAQCDPLKANVIYQNIVNKIKNC